MLLFVLFEPIARRTILFTTHFMDEADLLGQKVAIMTDGKLSTVGTPRFLKEKFGFGYHLNIAKGATCQDTSITKLVADMIPGTSYP